MANVKKNYGKITSYYSGVAKIEGLAGIFIHEVLINENKKAVGMIIGFNDKYAEAVLFDGGEEESLVQGSGEIFSIPVSEDYLGRVVNGFGQPIDGLKTIKGGRVSVFGPAPQIIDRQPVNGPLTTGIKIIDSTLPLGRGQRELLIGDRKLGKTTIAIDMVLNQRHATPKIYCIYVLCGKKRNELKEISNLITKKGAASYSVIVAATSASSLASQYLAPFVGCTIGEYFRNRGEDSLVIYDDLTKHAKAYRDISLLLERSPGREAYPGDIFSLHSRLLERAARFSDKKGGGSMSAIPIIETQEGDITSFIPTNLISITDGQIYVERGLFAKGFIPAINVGLSVSRVGSQAQQKNLKEVTGGIRLALSQQKELQKLTQLETVVNREAARSIFRGELILEFLKQEKHTKVGWREQSILFSALEEGYFDNVPSSQTKFLSELFLTFLSKKYPHLIEKSEKEDIKNLKSEIEKAVNDFEQEFITQ